MSALTRHVLYEKFSREKAAENFFVGFLNDHKIQVSDENPDSVFYVKNGEIFMQHNQKTGSLWVSYELIWLIFETKYSYKYLEIRELIKRQVWKHLKLKDVTPHDILFVELKMVWKHLKLKDVTPLCDVNQFLSLREVWKHLKLKDVTPFNVIKRAHKRVWKHLKLKDVIPEIIWRE